MVTTDLSSYLGSDMLEDERPEFRRAQYLADYGVLGQNTAKGLGAFYWCFHTGVTVDSSGHCVMFSRENIAETYITTITALNKSLLHQHFNCSWVRDGDKTLKCPK